MPEALTATVTVSVASSIVSVSPIADVSNNMIPLKRNLHLSVTLSESIRVSIVVALSLELLPLSPRICVNVTPDPRLYC